MKIKLFVPAIVLTLIATSFVPAFAGDPVAPAEGPKTGKEVLVIKESKDAQTFNAEGQDVTVNGNHNKVTITGACHALTVSGDMNFVSVAAVATITVAGSGNEVAWGKTVDGTSPQVTDTGKDNKIAHAAAKAD